MTTENQLCKSLKFCIFVFLGITLAGFFPKLNMFGFQLKVVDIFADLRTDRSNKLSNQLIQRNLPNTFDFTFLPYFNGFTEYLASSGGITPTLVNLNFDINLENKNKQHIFKLKEPYSANLKSLTNLVNGTSSLEDFSTGGYLKLKLFRRLNEIRKGEIKGHIAFYGDSFIEGDIFCADVRNSLQDYFGGNGVGFVPITSQVAQFRNTIVHSFKGFNSYSLVKKQTRLIPYGPGGFCFTAGEENSLTYSVSPNYKHLNLFHNISLYYTSPVNTIFKYQLDNSTLRNMNIVASDRLQQTLLNNVNVKKISFYFPASDTVKLYGVSFEDSLGVYVDNYSLRGNSGLNLMQIPELMHRQYNQFQNYQLIILQYGLNVLAPDCKDLGWYKNSMISEVEKLKKCYPDAAILIMSVPDRSTILDGKYKTMESIPLMVSAQREIARQTQSLFYNLYEAMGGENSMVAFVDNDPPLANKDYTHLNFLGGRKVGNIFVKNLLNEYKFYNDQLKRQNPLNNTLVFNPN